MYLHEDKEMFKDLIEQVAEDSGSESGRNIHCRPCESAISDFQGKEIAATIRSSDGC